MLRTFETIKRSSFYKPQLGVNFPSRSFSANASAEIKLTHNKFQQKLLPTHKTPLRGVMPQPSVTSADWHLYSNNLYTKFSVRDSNPQTLQVFGGVT